MSNPPTSITVGSRESPLALAQTHGVIARLQQHWPQLQCQLITFKTLGDQFLNQSFAELGYSAGEKQPLDKGLFIKELEVALLNGSIDLAVHSGKDCPTQQPEGLLVTPIGPRETPWDAWVSNQYQTLASCPPGTKIGTASVRRTAQVLAKYPHLQVVMVRGNVQTRLGKLEDGTVDGLILACAGLERLNLQSRITQVLTPTDGFVPAPRQGILGLEIRSNDFSLQTLIAPLQDAAVSAAWEAEEAVLKAIGGGCHTPVGAIATPDLLTNTLTLTGHYLSANGTQQSQHSVTGSFSAAALLGTNLGKLLTDDLASILS
ncbi:MAG: hydroxymethylbilane synthase [Vampirovibrionales bacterium]|nr:hydroxymethylbilane synthase [Vampirovibrionales bacterium]